ncbi:MAG: hypothetical protein ABSG78_16845 [Verrucomicrobiota bacterium]|jgi:hypothetical protein
MKIKPIKQAVLLFLLGGAAFGGAGPGNRDSETASRLAQGTVMRSFAPSLQAKESADFLLTPALLVQEILSDKTIVTYPSD